MPETGEKERNYLFKSYTVLASPSAQSGVLYLSKRSRSLRFRLQAPSAESPPRGPHSAKAAWFSPFSAKALWSSPAVAATPGFKFQCHSSPAAPFLTPPTIGYTCQHSLSFQLDWAATVNWQVCPHGMEPILSKLSHRCCNQGELLPSYILGGSHSQLPGSKHGHSYLTYP